MLRYDRLFALLTRIRTGLGGKWPGGGRRGEAQKRYSEWGGLKLTLSPHKWDQGNLIPLSRARFPLKLRGGVEKKNQLLIMLKGVRKMKRRILGGPTEEKRLAT